MKVPISKSLTESLSIPFVAVACIGIYDLYSTGQKRLEQNIVFIIFFGIPAILAIWFQFDKRVGFKDNKKVSKSERLFLIPFSSYSCLFVFIISTLFIVGGLATIFDDKDIATGLQMLLPGLTAFIFTAIAYDHPKVWFTDSYNILDDIERIQNTPKENFPMYQDGIFSYSDNGFTVKLDNATLTILWDEIFQIRAWKIDQFSVDCIIIEVGLKDTHFTVNDQTAGYMKFMDIAAEKLQDFKKDWFQVVAFPAFETNLTTIYERHESGEKQGSR